MKNDQLDHANRPLKHGVTSADMEAIQQRRIETTKWRHANAEENDRRAVKLGEALRALKGEG